jgi:hypothetical protein
MRGHFSHLSTPIFESSGIEIKLKNIQKLTFFICSISTGQGNYSTLQKSFSPSPKVPKNTGILSTPLNTFEDLHRSCQSASLSKIGIAKKETIY